MLCMLMQMKKFQFSGENGFLMCIRNVLDGFMAWYWRNLANGAFTPEVTGQVVSHHSPVTKLCDPGSNQSQHTGQSLTHQEISEKSLWIAWIINNIVKHVTDPSLSQIFVAAGVTQSLRGDTNKFKVPGLIPASRVTSQVCDIGAKYRRSGQGGGLPVFVTKINKWSAQGRETDRTVEEWIKHSSSGWQPGGYLIFVVIYSHSSLSGWLYLPDPESPVRSQAGNTFLRLLLTEICLTSIWTHSTLE